MIKYIDHYFDSNTWVIPTTINLNGCPIRNSGLKIKADFLDSSSQRHWGNYYYENWNTLGLYHNGEFFEVNIVTGNLLKIIQYSGISELGYLNGTFKLTPVKGKSTVVYRLIPEDSRENLFKSEISKTYHDPKIKFTHKMIPGHLYVSKSGYLYICLKNESLNYNSISGWGCGISVTPYKQKILLEITSDEKQKLDRLPIKSFDDLVKNFCFDNPYRIKYYSYKYSGKDLGKIVNEGDLINCILTPENISKVDTNILLSDELWKTNLIVKNELIRRVRLMLEKPYFNSNYPAFDRLRSELGI